MSDKTLIEWSDATANVVNGCSVLSPGCTNCYAMRLAGTRMKHHPSREGLTIDTKTGPVWNGEVKFNDKALMQVLSWTRPRKIFWNAHGDLFHENVPDEWIDKCFAVMTLTPQHKHQVLTKRSARMRAYFEIEHKREDWLDSASHLARNWKENANAVWHAETWPLPNVWLGVSVEDQERANERVPDLLDSPATVRWISAEPLLGSVNLRKISTWRYPKAEVLDALTGTLSGMFGDYCPTRLPRIDWVVAGGESGPRARPMHPDWARSLRDQCADTDVAFFMKQLSGKNGRAVKDIDQFPEDLRVRDYPNA